MRDFVLMAHIVLGLAIVLLVLFLLTARKVSTGIKITAVLSAALSWLILVPAGILYLIFYPATQSLIMAGAWPWAHKIVMEIKEHWGLLYPLVGTVGAVLVLRGKLNESKRWWILLLILTILLAVMGRMVKMGAAA